MGTVRYTVVDGEVLSELRNGVKRDYVPDPLGSTVALLDSTQNITDTFSYWPYGESAGRTGTTPTPFQYVGMVGYYQDGSGKNYIRARYLDKGKGCWITEDPINFEEGVNFYCYVMNSPTQYCDPTGKQKHNKNPILPRPPRVPPKFNRPYAPYPVDPPPHHIPGDYGHHCGLYVRTEPDPGVPVGNEDCIDTACMYHDRCIDGNQDKCMKEPGYIRGCDDKLCSDAKSCVWHCDTWPCRIQAGKVIAYYCFLGGSYIKQPGDRWKEYPPISPRLYPK